MRASYSSPARAEEAKRLAESARLYTAKEQFFCSGPLFAPPSLHLYGDAVIRGAGGDEWVGVRARTRLAGGHFLFCSAWYAVWGHTIGKNIKHKK